MNLWFNIGTREGKPTLQDPSLHSVLYDHSLTANISLSACMTDVPEGAHMFPYVLSYPMKMDA